MTDIRKINVLVFPCGSENAGEIFQSLRYSLHVNLFGASGVEDHGTFRFDNYIGGLANIKDDNFEEDFSDVIAKNKIDIVFATHDSVIEKLSLFSKKMGFYLVNGNIDATRIARKKSATYSLFQDCDWSPTIYSDIHNVMEWPVIIKPDMGQGGNGVSLAHNRNDALATINNTELPLLVEYLPGCEITVDCFTDKQGELIWIGPRTRERVRAGITMRSQYVELDDDISDIANTINGRLTLRGPWFFQLKKDRLNKWKLLEFSCRVSGTMVFQRARGVNLPLMTIHDFMGRSLSVLPNKDITLIDRCINTRAKMDKDYHSVYVDLDDTLIINHKAVPKIMEFLYQCVDEGKKIILITRHEFDISETLEEAKIYISIFDSIINIKNNECKSLYVNEGSIFIDNYFHERIDVAKNKSCLVLDVDAVELFIK